MKGFLVLEDGTVFAGTAFGAPTTTVGEVVFNTGMTGYQEVLTDPSYAGQMVCMTYPLIGNYGINPADFESRQPWVRGFIVKELCEKPSHWQANQSLDAYLKQHGIMGLAGIDTRALTRHLRDAGTMRGVLIALPDDVPGFTAARLAELVAMARSFEKHDHVLEVTTPEPVHYPGNGPKVVLMDFGAKQNIVRSLLHHGCDVTVVPALTSAMDILALRPDGIMLSNGPGDPRDMQQAIATIRELLQTQVPIFGICMGHQLLGLAVGMSAYKLKFGHRGANHPVKDLATGRVYITSQNHGWALDESTLPAGVRVSHINLNDGTVEGLTFEGKPVFSVQYHPEAAPGPHDSDYLFERFLNLMCQPALAG
jgi:carbamoyl-phosphate synthase small subunit